MCLQFSCAGVRLFIIIGIIAIIAWQQVLSCEHRQICMKDKSGKSFIVTQGMTTILKDSAVCKILKYSFAKEMKAVTHAFCWNA